MIIASISKLSSSHALFLPIFDSCFLISVSFTDDISHCTGSVGSSSSLSLCAGLHNLFAKGFKAGRRQTLILLLYQGLGPATEKNYYFLYKKLKKDCFYFFQILKNRVGGSVNQVIKKKGPTIKKMP